MKRFRKNKRWNNDKFQFSKFQNRSLRSNIQRRNSRYNQQVTFKKKCHTASLTMEIMSVDKAFGLFWDDNKPITLNMLRQKQKSIKGGELQLIPISPADMTAYRFPHAIPLLINATRSFSVYEEHSMTIELCGRGRSTV